MMVAVKLPKGIHCPVCKRVDVLLTGRYRPLPGTRVRYFRCALCAARFKTVERFGGPLQPRKPADPGRAS